MKRRSEHRGSFYPSKISDIDNFIELNLNEVKKVKDLKALILPHAGWIYSGSVACKGLCLKPTEEIKRIYLIGPSHRLGFYGAALSNYDAYETPYGDFTIDKITEEQLLKLTDITVIDEAHKLEHSLEVQLPFLKYLYPNALLIPIVAGSGSTKVLSKILEVSMVQPHSLTIISSDLSHFKPYEQAKKIDLKSIETICTQNDQLSPSDACGQVIINALIPVIKKLNLDTSLIEYKNSGDTAGDKGSVVGYCSIAITKRDKDNG